MAKQNNEPQAPVPALLRGKEYWRSLEELHSTPEFRESVRPEFVEGADSPEGVNRRDFMKLLGASTALAGVIGCAPGPNEKVLPYTVRPQDVNAGLPLYYATSMVLDGFAQGLLVKSTDGRPTKVEGNPDHPAANPTPGEGDDHAPSSLFAQASVLSLYDPDRARGPFQRVAVAHGKPGTLQAVPSSRQKVLAALRAAGPRLRFVIEPQSSPFVGSLLGSLAQAYPQSKVTFYSPLARTNPAKGAALVYGQPAEAQYDFSKADVVLALDSDFTAEGPFALRWARQFSDKRRIQNAEGSMNRLYVAEPTPTPTGSLADHRLRVKSGLVRGLAAAVLAKLSGEGLSAPGVSAGDVQKVAQETQAHDAWVSAVAKDLKEHQGSSVVIAGDRQPPAVHALVHAINAALGNVGKTVSLSAPALVSTTEGHPLADLVAEIKSGAVDAVVIFDGNPSYNAPSELAFSEVLRGAKNTFYFGLYENETAADCEWFIPSAHYLESWGDARAYDGTVSLVQPLIEPMYGGVTLADLLYSLVAPEDRRTSYQRLRSFWASQALTNPSDVAPAVPLPELNFQKRWDEYLQKGVIPGSAPAALSLSFNGAGLSSALSTPADLKGVELNLVASPAVYDGRFANNGWLQEWPNPMTKLTWDTALIVSPKTAEGLGVPFAGYRYESVPLVTVSVGGRELNVPLFILPGQADDTATLHLGYGRSGAESSVAQKSGAFNAYTLRTAAAPDFVGGVRLDVTREQYPLSVTQGHWSMATDQGRPVVAPIATMAEYKSEKFKQALEEYKPEAIKTKSLFTPSDSDTASKEYNITAVPTGVPDPVKQFGVEQWAMTIDTSVCNGCSACIVACQAENNISIVGKEGVGRTREMHWLRIDRYFVTQPGHEDEVEIVNQPMACQHCENAPCEYVCPVNATVHSSDGLNEMIYNRCIGTRFCLNNCPYKARRFNFFNYVDKSSNKMVRNPDVTVRARGVMEKCSFCVQRIRQADIRAQIEGREIRDGEVVTACQQACPTRAISFGSLRHKETEVVKRREQDKSYAVLNELGAKPRVQYLAKISNPNSALEAKASGPEGQH